MPLPARSTRRARRRPRRGRQAAAAIEVDPELYTVHPMRMEVKAVDPEKGDRYRLYIYLDESGTVYETEATYREGVFAFDSKSDDASHSYFEGQLAGEGTLSGTFTATAWGFIKDALIGSWTVQRLP
ncbi:MAG: hypothetical protein U9Q70_05240 [Chloroflexota bacterium]|nr:hypothetical protein [Chloroflexota bacterium]